MKRQKLVKQPAEHLKRIPVPTSKLTPVSTPSVGVSHSRASTEHSLQPVDSDGKRDGARTPRSFLIELHTADDGDDSAYNPRASEGLLPSRGAVSPFEGITGGISFSPDSERCGKNREDSSGEFGGSHDELNQDDVLFPRYSAKPSQRCKRSNRPLEKKRHGSSRITLGRRCSSTMQTRASRQATSSQPQPMYRPPMDNHPRSCSPRALSPGTKAETNTNHRPSIETSYHITDFTLCTIPNGSSIVTVVFYYRDSKWPPDPAALGPKFLGGDVKVIRMTQLSPDSWMLLGYRYDDDASGLGSGRSLKADWTSEPRSDATNHETNSSDDDWDEKSEKGEEGIETCGKRTHKPWLESDELLLLSLKDNQGMEWKKIYKRFPDRTHPAVKLRYYMLRKKDQ
jgi:hypothetical protein